MKVDADGYSFDFADALDAFVFDEKDKSKPTFHGQPMKAVDIIAEFQDLYIFVEIKQYDDIKDYKTGFYVSFEVDGKKYEETILDPSSKHKLTPYLYIYLYDSYNYGYNSNRGNSQEIKMAEEKKLVDFDLDDLLETFEKNI